MLGPFVLHQASCGRRGAAAGSMHRDLGSRGFVGSGLLLQGRCNPNLSAQINSADELVATEIIFGGALSEMEPGEAGALLSALVFQVGGFFFCSYTFLLPF